MASLLQRLKPTDREARELALRETDPAEAEKLAPITRGPIFAILAVPVVVLLAVPSCVARLVRDPSRDEDTQ